MLINQTVPDDEHLAGTTPTRDTTNLRNPDRGTTSCPNSARGLLSRAISPDGGSPV
jgi:hypothetical protein